MSKFYKFLSIFTMMYSSEASLFGIDRTGTTKLTLLKTVSECGEVILCRHQVNAVRYSVQLQSREY